MTWNYRVMRVEHPVPEPLEPVLGKTQTIYEVIECYYDEDDAPLLYGDAGLDSAETPEELRSALIHALSAVEDSIAERLAVLTAADFAQQQGGEPASWPETDCEADCASRMRDDMTGESLGLPCNCDGPLLAAQQQGSE
jgi:hypothetical protein